MNKIVIWILAFFLGMAIPGQAQSNATDKLIGTWRSVNRPDTLTLRIVDKKTAYFDMKVKAPFVGKPFSYFVYRIDRQMMMELTPLFGKTGMKLYLWILGPDEIKLQGVDAMDYDNPTQHIPAETNQNTFRMKRSG